MQQIRTVTCPMCRNISELHLENEDIANRVDRYMSNNLLPDEQNKSIQLLFPTLSPDERELILTGLCSKCYQELCDKISDC